MRIAGGTSNPATEPTTSPINPTAIGVPLSQGAGARSCSEGRIGRYGCLRLATQAMVIPPDRHTEREMSAKRERPPLRAAQSLGETHPRGACHRNTATRRLSIYDFGHRLLLANHPSYVSVAYRGACWGALTATKGKGRCHRPRRIEDVPL